MKRKGKKKRKNRKKRKKNEMQERISNVENVMTRSKIEVPKQKRELETIFEKMISEDF